MHEWVWCEDARKRGYGSAEAARKAHESASARLRIYRCPRCRRLHVTSQEKRGQPDAPKRKRRFKRPVRTIMDPKMHRYICDPTAPGSCWICAHAEGEHVFGEKGR